MSMIESGTQILQMMDNSGLSRDQFAINFWGFPPIPKPTPRRRSAIVRLAPKNVKDEFLGHPIYWVETELSAYREGESDNDWSIRMYYLLLHMGFWQADGAWVNFLSSKGFRYLRADVEGYHMGSNPQISADRDAYRFLNENDVRGGLEMVDARFQEARLKCERYEDSSIKSFVRRQANALIRAHQILGGNDALTDPQMDANDSAGSWVTHIEPELYELSDRYRAELAKDAPNMASILDDAENVYRKIQNMLASFDHITASIAIPVLRGRDVVPTNFQQIVSQLSLAASQASTRGRGDRIMEMARSCFSGHRHEKALDKVNDEIYDMYVIAWRRMRLALVNYGMLSQGNQPLATYQSMEIYLLSKGSATRDADFSDAYRSHDELIGSRSGARFTSRASRDEALASLSNLEDVLSDAGL
ncbi:hypothetical protein [Rhodococcus sp. IEGM 1406]|uniref:hypothetical protein n=1 Tax=Rhodococcus sp. IEGM 1406 TaxID=3047083 RepID=UPI0024B7A08B|nr:hypothetical protein [Rhodococcus sp. IEGM 1406]MDI9907972.1 hypothetical protein [Rhodococcus sp. IEGM 1406]